MVMTGIISMKPTATATSAKRYVRPLTDARAMNAAVVTALAGKTMPVTKLEWTPMMGPPRAACQEVRV